MAHGGQRDVGDAPLIGEYGFDNSLTNFEGLGPRVLGYKNAFNGKPAKLQDLGSNKLGHGPIQYANRSEITGVYVDKALKHIDRAAELQQPFYINVWPDDVHSPFFPPKVLRDKTGEKKRQLYDAVLKAMDDQLAPLLDRIRDDERLSQNTLIVICSDNGPEPGAGAADPLRGSKGMLYEGGIRSPLIVWGPGLLNPDTAGTTNDKAILSAMDINRSLHALCGVSPPQAHNLDGEDLSATLLGKSKAGRQAPIFWRRPPDRPGSGGASPEDYPDLAVRDGKWKYLVNLDGSDPQLYDLESDQREATNVATGHPDVAERLHQLAMAWNAGLPEDAGSRLPPPTDTR